jgi:hypothetical protein
MMHRKKGRVAYLPWKIKDEVFTLELVQAFLEPPARVREIKAISVERFPTKVNEHMM